MKPDFFDTDKAINHPDFKSSPCMIKKGLKPLKDGKDETLSEGAHFQTSKAQTIPLRTGGRNLDDFLKNTTDQVLCPFFNWVVCFPGVESCEFFRILNI